MRHIIAAECLSEVRDSPCKRLRGAERSGFYVVWSASGRDAWCVCIFAGIRQKLMFQASPSQEKGMTVHFGTPEE